MSSTRSGWTISIKCCSSLKFITVFIYVAVFLLSFVPLLLIPIFVYRRIVRKCAATLRPDLSHMLRGQSFLFLKRAAHLEPWANLMYGFRVQSSTGLNFERVKLLIAQRLVYAKELATDLKGRNVDLKYPELQQYCVRWFGYFFWTQDLRFSIDEHVRYHALAPGETVAQAQVNFAKETHSENKSPWQVLIVEDPAFTAEYSAFFKFHHSLADGHSAIRAIMCCIESPETNLLQTATPPTNNGKIQHILTYPFRVVLEFTRILTREYPSLPWKQLPSQSWRPFQTYGQEIVVGDGPISMTLVKSIAKRHEVSVNAVMQAAITGAVRKYLLTKCPSNLIPDHVTTFVPIPVRHHPQGLCNSLAMAYRLPVGEPDPLKRLTLCDQMLKEGKKSLEGHVMYMVLEAISILPVIFPFQQVIEYLWPLQMLLATNIPGPIRPVKFDGDEVISMNDMFPEPPSIFYIAMVSYNGWIQYACTGDTRVLGHDLAEMGRLFAKEFVAMEEMSSIENVSPIRTN